jgi:hypothetical protein
VYDAKNWDKGEVHYFLNKGLNDHFLLYQEYNQNHGGIYSYTWGKQYTIIACT